ncbi:protein serine/threonine phosphatase [Syntrophothermus lipocalidus DSM 12680]|uniref:Protein serine/threonine phosphatase n=2 Tax=Syntrophothermus TaxID=129001 RepID=D7CLR0_SYNLT|nr:protein serine/threonine phosphatase [Syntrophothermus lipocalidus DSM 12680]
MQVAAISDTGLVRGKNEDRFLARPKQGLFAVCDGMGGHKGGEVAASLAVDVIDMGYSESEDPVSSLAACVDTANQLIFSIGNRVPEYQGMGTTLTAVLVRDNRLWVAHIGDSSLYCLSGGRLQKITHDHTLAQKMVDQGLMAPAEGKKHPFSHILTRALGMEVSVEADYICRTLKKGDYILLATDGLTDLVEDREIEELINRFGIESHIHMVKTALQRGGHDNITVVLVKV